MSSFSSVVQKPGKKIIPKAAPRRNVQRKTVVNRLPTPTSSQPEEVNGEETSVQEAQSTSATALETSITQATPSIEEAVQSSRSPANVLSPTTTEHTSPPPPPPPPPPPRSPSIESTDAPVPVAIFGFHSQPSPVLDSLPVVSIEADVVPTVESSDNEPPINKEVRQDVTHDSPVQSLETAPGVNISTHNAQNSVEATTRRQSTADHTELLSSPRKRRRVTPRATSAVVSTRNSTPRSIVPSSTPVSSQPTQQSRQNETPEDLFQSATRRAASVSEMANAIDSQTRQLRPRSQRTTTVDSRPASIADSSERARPPTTRTKRARQKKNAVEQAAEVVANALGKSKGSARQRTGTPEGAEDYELEPAKVTMGELCEDSKNGKKSTLETEMQANWPEILQRRKEDREQAMANAEKHRRKGYGSKMPLLAAADSAPALAPAMTVVNGVIVVDQSSREIDRGAQLTQAAMQDLENVREDRNYYKYVNQATVGMKPGRGHHSKWDEESTDRFFKGLQMFGTDFLMIANMFPGLSRKQIKAKFIREEKADRGRVHEALRNREAVQLEDYAQMANKETEEFHNLESIQMELDAQEQRLRDEDDQRRRREGFITAGTGDSAAQPPQNESEEGTGRQTESVEPGRFDAMAREVVDAATGSKKRSRKTTTASNRKGLKNGRRPEAGIEEVLGNISEVAV